MAVLGDVQWGGDLHQDKTLKPGEPAEGVAERCSWGDRKGECHLGHTEKQSTGTQGELRFRTDKNTVFMYPIHF